MFNRLTLSALLGAATALALSAPGIAQDLDWPTRPITLIVGSNPGGQGDLAARRLAEPLSQVLGQRVIVENRSGAGGMVAAAAVADAEPNGYTFLQSTEGIIAIQPALRADMPYDALTAFIPVIATVDQVDVLTVNPNNIAVTTVAELIEELLANPGRYRYGSTGVGINQHLEMELFQVTTGTEMVHVPFPSGVDAATALLGGHIDLAMTGSTSTEPYILDGTLVGLGVASAEPLNSLPDLPPIAETVEGFEFSTWNGVFAPAGTPTEIVEAMNAAIQEVMAMPAVAQAHINAGDRIVANSVEEFAEMVARDIEVWASIVEDAGVTLD